jgi:hypothetical protein
VEGYGVRCSRYSSILFSRQDNAYQHAPMEARVDLNVTLIPSLLPTTYNASAAESRECGQQRAIRRQPVASETYVAC